MIPTPYLAHGPAALRTDLLRLHAKVEAALQPGARRRRFLLLIDDVHRMGETAHQLLRFLLGDRGLQHDEAHDLIRVVIAYSATQQLGQVSALKAIQNAAGEIGMEELTLTGFRPPENQLAYRQFLLNWKSNNKKDGPPMPLTLAQQAPTGFHNFFFDALQNQVRGIPSNLVENDGVRDIVESGMKNGILRQATDEDKLKAWHDEAKEIGP